MSEKVSLLDVVALVDDPPAENLRRGQVGTAVEELDPGVFEVEFSDLDGKTYAMTPVRAEKLIVLHYRPFRAA